MRTRVNVLRWGSCLLMALAVTMNGCYRGRPSTKPPIHIVPNMDKQEKYVAQASGPFFANDSAMRPPVEHAVARGYLRDNTVYYQGRDEAGNFVRTSPVPTTMALLRRGQERFDIYCTVCHDGTGSGHGIVIERGFQVAPSSYHVDRLREIEDGYLFDIITNGSASKLMSPYRHQIAVPDRWAIVAYIRALQRSQNASINDIPEAEVQNLQP